MNRLAAAALTTLGIVAAGAISGATVYEATSAMASAQTSTKANTANCAFVLGGIETDIGTILKHRTGDWRAQYAYDLKLQTQTQAECNKYLLPAKPKPAGPQAIATYKGTGSNDDLTLTIPAKDKTWSVGWWYNCPSSDSIDCHSYTGNEGGNFSFTISIYGMSGTPDPNLVSGVVPNVDSDGVFSAHGSFVGGGTGKFNVQVDTYAVNWTVKVYP